MTDLPSQGTTEVTMKYFSLYMILSFTLVLRCVLIVDLQDGKALESGRDPFLHVTAGGEALSFLRVQPRHAANYTCRASSAAGEDTLTYNVNVNGQQ